MDTEAPLDPLEWGGEDSGRLLRIWLDFADADQSSYAVYLPAIPRIGESVAVRHDDPPREAWIKLYRVTDVKHYTAPEPQIRVVLGKPS
jgi:hypothetical protein